MSHASIELSTRRIVHSLNLLEIQAADDNKLSGAELDAFNKRVNRGPGGQFASGGGGSSKLKVEEKIDGAIDKISDARLEKGQSLMKVEKDRAVSKAVVAKTVDAIYSSPEKTKAAFNSIGPNISGAIDSIGKNFDGKSKEINDNVHKMMDGIGAGIRSNSQNVSDTIGKDIIAAKLYLETSPDAIKEAIGKTVDFTQGFQKRAKYGSSENPFLEPETDSEAAGQKLGNLAYGAKKAGKAVAQAPGKAISKVEKEAGDFGRGAKEGFTESETPSANSMNKAGRLVGRAALDASSLAKEAGASIGRAATGLAAFMSPEHLSEVGKNLSKAAMDGVKQTPAKIKSMLDDLAKKAKESIDKGTTAIKDFGSGVSDGFMEGANNKYLEKGVTLKVGKPELDNAAKAAGRKVGQFAGDRPMLTGSAVGLAEGAVIFGSGAAAMTIPLVVGIAIGEDLAHPQSQIRKHIGDAYNTAKSKIDSLRDKPDAAKPMSGKEKQETKDKLDRSTASLAVATIAKDDKKIEQHKNEIADLTGKIQSGTIDALKNANAAVADLDKKLEPMLEQVRKTREENPAAFATGIGVALGSLVVGPGAFVLGIPAIGVAKGVDNLSNKAKVQASVFPQLMMASVIGASAKKMAHTI